ncbi:hypothetical protein ACOME3_002061 [Neoechinorhynchus agilis]
MIPRDSNQHSRKCEIIFKASRPGVYLSSFDMPEEDRIRSREVKLRQNNNFISPANKIHENLTNSDLTRRGKMSLKKECLKNRELLVRWTICDQKRLRKCWLRGKFQNFAF